MAKTRNVQVPQTVPNGTNDLSVTFYISDPASGSVPRVTFQWKSDQGQPVSVDRPLSDFSSLNGAAKLQLRNSLVSLRDECFTLEGFV